ncbi:hypothetical protein [Embleya sp. NBC_00896]|uniref:hypothetical protein n=1 Tax=Embleya sp. NBC_00896 TaxID=2975961 RepID=UPI002F91516F|nr:hypothetical protein OG928_48290 [Embleya sp. NBC_00896]
MSTIVETAGQETTLAARTLTRARAQVQAKRNDDAQRLAAAVRKQRDEAVEDAVAYVRKLLGPDTALADADVWSGYPTVGDRRPLAVAYLGDGLWMIHIRDSTEHRNRPAFVRPQPCGCVREISLDDSGIEPFESALAALLTDDRSCDTHQGRAEDS